jgi:hypothetical protein
VLSHTAEAAQPPSWKAGYHTSTLHHLRSSNAQHIKMASSHPEKPFNNFYTPENSAFYSANVYQPLDPEAGDFRVLEILPGSNDDVVQCRLIKSFQGIEYEALSYRAGDPTDVKEILVDGHPFNAFATLFGALIALRGLSESRIVWIDQICINQNDIEERNHQVTKMRDVYQNAQRVVAWLGPLCDGGELAIDAAHSFYEDWLSRVRRAPSELSSTHPQDLNPKAIRDIAGNYVEHLLLADRMDNEEVFAEAKSLGHVFNSEFWNRVWIWQELIVARSICILWDTKIMDFLPFHITAEILNLAITFTLASNHRSRAASYIYHPVGLPRTLVLMVATFRQRGRWNTCNVLDFRRILRGARRARSSDPRDRIFALSGLIHPKHGIVPNYTETVASVYCSASWSIITTERSLEILAACLHPRGPNEMALPSWCPDWSRESAARRERLLPADGEDLHFNACKTLVGSCRMEACKDGETDIASYVLFVEGVVVSSVQELGSLPKYSNIESTKSSEVFGALLEDWRSLINAKRPSTEQLMSELKRTVTVSNGGRCRTETSTSRYSIPTELFKRNAVSGDRRFFITEEGLMGMAPPHVLPGDIICILQGTRMPLLLRPEGAFYTLVGEVYVSDGYMEGRAFDEMEQGKRALQEFELH